MAKKYQYAMALYRWYKNPDLFITMTTNAKYIDINDYFEISGDDSPNYIFILFIFTYNYYDIEGHKFYFINYNIT